MMMMIILRVLFRVLNHNGILRRGSGGRETGTGSDYVINLMSNSPTDLGPRFTKPGLQA